MQAVTFFSMVAPKGTPPAEVAAMQKNVSAVLAKEDVKQRFLAQGASPRGWNTDETRKFIQAESAKWSKVIKAANVTVE